MKELILEYIDIKDVHSIFNITFEELLQYVWNRIKKHNNTNDIKKILNDEMQDSECKCFTGRISRLVNCLNGYYDDIKVNIGENEQIGNIVTIIMEKVKNKYTGDKYIKIVKEEIVKELKERGYTEETIKEWIENIE